MSDIPDSIAQLSDGDLRSELGKVGMNVGPITPTTRRLFQNRLAKKLGVLRTFQSVVKVTGKESFTQTEEAAPDKSVESEDPAQKKDGQLYYGVFVPTSDEKVPIEPIVFQSKSSTLLSMKEHKDARFKVFPTYEAAKVYSMKGTLEDARKSSSLLLENENGDTKFKSLKQEDLNKFMKFVEKGDIEEMRRLIWENPKYIISSADGPVVLKASVRYNALHVAARSNQPAVCVEILSTLENLAFHALLYPKVVDPDVVEQRIEHILDLYLNTPEKGMYETPLHIASKLGFKDVVSELVSYTQCSTTAQNKFGDTPHDVICARTSAEKKGIKSEIERLLGEQYFIPLLRYQDNCEHAIIGTPLNVKHCPSDYAAMSPVLANQVSSPSVGNSPLRPALTISALAGPMSKEQAARFQKVWTTPSRQEGLKKSLTHLRRMDSEKGDEHIGRQLAAKERVGWVEFWDFLSDFANFGMEDGLVQLEEYLAKRHRKSASNTAISTDETPSEIVELSDMFKNIHINGEAQKKNKEHRPRLLTADKFGQRNLENGTEHLADCTENVQAMEIDTEKITGVEETSTDKSANPEIELQAMNLVKKLFEDEKPETKEQKNTPVTNFSVEHITDNLSKCLSIDHKLKTSANDVFIDNWFSQEPKYSECQSPATIYRCTKSSSSEVFSSPSSSTSSGSILSMGQRETKCGRFLIGEAPTKLDRDVLMAIEGKDLDNQKYPAITRWKSAVLSFSDKDRQKWGTPKKNGKPTKLSPPPRSYSVSGALSTPTSTPNKGFTNTFTTPNRNMRRYLCRSFTPSNGE